MTFIGSSKLTGMFLVSFTSFMMVLSSSYAQNSKPDCNVDPSSVVNVDIPTGYKAANVSVNFEKNLDQDLIIWVEQYCARNRSISWNVKIALSAATSKLYFAVLYHAHNQWCEVHSDKPNIPAPPSGPRNSPLKGSVGFVEICGYPGPGNHPGNSVHSLADISVELLP